VTRQGVVRTDPDGTRHYASGHTYKPKPVEERKYKIRKPSNPRAVRFKDKWFEPLPVLIDSLRTMPDTRPDVLFVTHRFMCQCRRCQVPGILRQKRRLAGLNPQTAPAAAEYMPHDLFRYEGLPHPHDREAPRP
jgi:hypothetical protein